MTVLPGRRMAIPAARRHDSDAMSAHCQFDCCGTPTVNGLGPRCRRRLELGGTLSGAIGGDLEVVAYAEAVADGVPVTRLPDAYFDRRLTA